MKKSSGTAFRARVQGSGLSEQGEQVRSKKANPRWKGYLGAGGAVIILMALILPCQYRRCGSPADSGTRAYRWVLTGASPGTLKRAPDNYDFRRGGHSPADSMLHGMKRSAPDRDAVPADKKRMHDAGDSDNEEAGKPGDRSEQLGNIETAEQGVIKPDEKQVKKPEKPKVYDFGTKLELVIPAPSN